MSLFMCSFLGHSWFLLSSIVHFHFVFLWVLLLSSRLYSLMFSLMWWWHAHPGATSQAYHTLHSTCRFWSRILRLRDHLGWEVWGSFGWTMLVWHLASFGCSAQKKKKKKCLFGIYCYTWDHQTSFGFERFIIPPRVRWEHYTILLHGFGWHIGSEVWVLWHSVPWIIVYITFLIL